MAVIVPTLVAKKSSADRRARQTASRRGKQTLKTATDGPIADFDPTGRRGRRRDPAHARSAC